MKFLLLAPWLDKGGSERFISNLSLMLAENHEVIVAIFDNVVKYPVGGKLVDLQAPPKSNPVSRVLTVFERCRKVKKLVKEFKPDVVLSVMTSANRVNTLCNFKGVKQFVSCRGFAELKAEPEVFKNSANKTDGVIFNSQEAKEYFCKELGGPADKAFYNYNLIDLERISKGIQEPVNDPELEAFIATHNCVVNMGSLSAVKCQKSLIKAFEILQEKVPDSGLVIIGGRGDMVEDVYKAAKESSCSQNIFMAGNKDNPYNIMAKCQLYALSSRAEGFPNAMVEAMACGLGVVSTECMTGPGEILRADYTGKKATDCELVEYGILTPLIEGNEAIYAKALEMALTDEELNCKLREKATARLEDFTSEKALNDFLEIVSG